MSSWGKTGAKPVVPQPLPRPAPSSKSPDKAPAETSPVPPPSSPGVSAAAQKAVGKEEPKRALSSSAGEQVGNAFASRLAFMTGTKDIKGTKGALAEVAEALAEGRVPTSLPLGAVDELPIDRAGGVAFQLDAAKVSGQRVTLRRVEHPEHGPGLEVSFKLRGGHDIEHVEQAIKEAGGKKGALTKEKMTADERGVLRIDTAAEGYEVKAGRWKATAAEAHVLEDDGRFSVEMLDHAGPQALRGAVRLRVFGEGKEASAALNDAIAKAGLGAAFEDSTVSSRGLANQLRVLWQRDPKAAQELANKDLSKVSAREIDNALRAAGIKPETAANLPSKEVFPGHFTTVNPTQADEYKELGVQYLFSGVGSLDAAAAILAGDGLMSTLERYDRGLIIEGKSSQSDIDSGGADYVFTRMVTDKAEDVPFTRPFASGKYQIVIDPQVLERTDWFAYPADEFGTTKDLKKFTARQYGEELVKSLMKKGYNGKERFSASNEVMFQRGVSKEHFQGVTTQAEADKEKLIEALTAKGVTEIGGKPLAEAITVQKNLLE